MTLYGHSEYVYSVAFSSGNYTLSSASHDKTVRTWCARRAVLESFALRVIVC